MSATDIIQWGLLSGVFASVYHGILIAPGKILSKPRRWLEGAVNWIGLRSGYGGSYDIATFITKSLIDCAWCMAGQVAIVVYLWHGGRDVVDLALMVTTSILVCHITFKYLTDVQEKQGRTA